LDEKAPASSFPVRPLPRWHLLPICHWAVSCHAAAEAGGMRRRGAQLLSEANKYSFGHWFVDVCWLVMIMAINLSIVFGGLLIATYGMDKGNVFLTIVGAVLSLLFGAIGFLLIQAVFGKCRQLFSG
jgi:hypothetical protein